MIEITYRAPGGQQRTDNVARRTDRFRWLVDSGDVVWGEDIVGGPPAMALQLPIEPHHTGVHAVRNQGGGPRA